MFQVLSRHICLQALSKVFAALLVGVSLVSILQAVDLASVYSSLTLFFLTYVTSRDWHHDSLQHAVLILSE